MARALLITTRPEQARAVQRRLEALIPTLPRREIIEGSFAGGSAILVVDTLEEGIAIVNELAPEHLEILTEDPFETMSRIRNAGAIFVGTFTAVPFGDYGVASNHVLPTAGTARFASGLRASDFVKVMSVVEMDEGAAHALAPEVSELARSEGLVGHARAVEVRAEDRRRAP